VAREWGVDLGEPFVHDGATAWVAPAGDHAVLKVVWPHEEATFEADGLRAWDGSGVIRLLRHDRGRWALLLERCRPGTALGARWSDDTVDLGCSIARRLWREVDADAPFDDVASVCRRWAEVARERADRLAHGLDAGVVALAIEHLDGLARAERHLLHGDLHPGNVLAAQREPWLVIDPKPIVGDRGFDATRLVTQGVRDPAHLRARAALLEDLLGIDGEHLRRWALARTVEAALWSIDLHGDARGWDHDVAVVAATL
jgi:streptomycin 6-kinase